MARIRSIKPEFWIDEKIVELTPWARLLFVGMWNFADDYGFIEYKPKRLKMQIFPADDVDVASTLAEILAQGLVEPHASPIGPVLRIVNWSRHQRVEKAGKRRFELAELSPITPGILPESSRNVPASIPDPSFQGEAAAKGPAPTGKSSADTEQQVGDPASGDLLILQTLREGSGKAPEGSGAEKEKEKEKEGRREELPPSAGETPNQRANRLAKIYTDRVKPSNFPAVAKVVRKAVDADCPDELIVKGLNALADGGRSCTTDALRIAMYGAPRSTGTGPHRPYKNPDDQSVYDEDL